MNPELVEGLPEAKARQRRSENRCVKRRALHSQGGTDIRQRLVRRLAAVIDHRPDPRNNIRRLILFLYAGSFPIGQLPKAKPTIQAAQRKLLC